jgi:hypothetical protein
MSALKEVLLPEFGSDQTAPEIPVVEYEQRLSGLIARMKAAKLDVAVVYADREHSANLSFLCGFDPRFEEALLLLDISGARQLVVGNECMCYLPDERLRIQSELFQDFSLMGQKRGNSKPLRTILSSFGIRTGRTVGCIGWKYYDSPLVEGGAHALDLPSYIADTIRDLAGGRGNVTNATALLMNPRDGMRLHNSATQIAQFEYASCLTSNAIVAAVRGIKPGVRERELARLFQVESQPMSCHPMTSFGDKAKRGLASPGNGEATVGGAFTLALGIWGALTCRAGMVVKDASQLDGTLSDFYPRMVGNYFDVMVAWYEAIRVGATGGDVYAAVEARRDKSLYDFALNPGHYLHLDEWVHSPFALGDKTQLPSGAAIQMDIIPVVKGPFCCTNGEDGIALGDKSLRDQLAREYPSAWSRIQRRREFMTTVLGIKLDESVLPLSNCPAWLPPFGLNPRQVFVTH